MNSYIFHISLYDFFFVGAIFIGLTFSLLLWFVKNVNHAANKLLALAVAVIVVVMARTLLTDIRQETYLSCPKWLSLQFSLAIGPLIYCYVLKLTRPDYKLSWKDLLHFSPVLLDLGALIFENYRPFGAIIQLLALISIIFYTYCSRQVIEKFCRRLQPVLMDRQLSELRWLRRLLNSAALLCLSWLLYVIINYFTYHNRPDAASYDPFYLSLTAIIIWIGVASFLRVKTEALAQTPQTFKSSQPLDLREKGNWLKKTMETTFLYQDAELSLGALADKLGLHSHELSRIINIALKKNFNDFVNEYRVRDVVRKMHDPAYDRITLLGIAFESGFNSKTTFNRTFRQMTGKTPAEFKKALKKERPTYNLERFSPNRRVILNHDTIPQWSHGQINYNYMFRNYLKVALRNLKVKKTFSFINITGLAVGMAGAILIMLWIQNEYSYDSFHTNNKTLYKVWNRYMSKDYIGMSDVTASPMGAALKDGFPEVKSSARVYWTTDRLFNYKDVSLKAKGNDVDKAFLTMFSFPLTEGNASHALDDVNSIVITQSLAKKIFKDADPLNQLVKIAGTQTFKVTGVLKDLPNNTEFDFEYLVSLAANERYYTDGSWGNNSYYTYVQLQPGANGDQLNKKVQKLAIQHGQKDQEVFLYPFSKMHLYSRFDNGKVAGGRIEIVRLLLGIAGIILLIACINFMNLSTAQSQKRAKEVGVRKVMGAARFSLISQFLTESLAITLIAGMFALALAQLCLSAFNQLTSKQLFINYADPVFWLAFLGFIVFTGVIAGSYPAFFLSAFRPVKVLKGKLSAVRSAISPRKVLVVLQFSVAIVLIISTVVVYRQIKFAQNRDAGYNSDRLVEIPIEGDIRKNYQLIKNDLINSGAATAMCQTSLDVTLDGATGGGFSTDGVNKDQQNISFSRFGTSGDFIKTMGLKLIAGRDVDFTAYPSDSVACLLNETAVKQLGMKDPIGNFVKNGTFPIKVVGVFKDFIIRSPYVNTGPMIVFATKGWIYNTVIRFSAQNDMAKNLQIAEGIFKKYNSAYPFTYNFVDTQYQKKFNDQQQTGKLAAVFACLTIFISCLGLFGLASYMAESRAKEIGIRKVLGASVASITQMLAREFVALVVIAIVVAVPVAWWASSKWLQDFTYRISIGWVTFAVAGASAILIAVLTVSYQSIKAAIANPVNSIKAE